LLNDSVNTEKRTLNIKFKIYPILKVEKKE
jgi:hypothetical protein